jgi:WD40 repeat protein
MTTLVVEPRLERFVLTATDDGDATVWALDGSIRRVSPLRGLQTYIVAAAFLPLFRHGEGAPEDLVDRTLIVTAGGDGSVMLWDGVTGQRLRLFSGHCDEVTSLDVSGKGRFILTSGADGTCRVWDLRSHVIEPPVPHLGGVRVRPYLQLLLFCCSSQSMPPILCYPHCISRWLQVLNCQLLGSVISTDPLRHYFYHPLVMLRFPCPPVRSAILVPSCGLEKRSHAGDSLAGSNGARSLVRL